MSNVIAGVVRNQIPHLEEHIAQKKAKVINMVLLPMWLEKDINGYPILMLCLSIAAIPLLLLEYFYTRERITEDMAVEVGLGKENSVPLLDQMRALLSNKYYVILTVLATCTGIVDNFKGGNVQYFYVKFLLSGAEDPMMFTIYQIATGIPLGLGGYLCLPRRPEDRHPELHLHRVRLHPGGEHFGAAVPLQPAHRHHSRVPAPGRSDPQQLRVRYPVVLCL